MGPHSSAQTLSRTRLVARHRLGVPVHDAPSDRGKMRRVPDGTEVTVRAEVSKNWLEVAFADGSEGFVTRRYLLPAAPSVPSASSGATAPALGRAAICERAKQHGRAPRANGESRLATFNVRWFPDGVPGKKAPAAGGTDLELLACSIAETGAEVVLVQEFKTGERAALSLRAVLLQLNALTHGDWQAAFDDCPIETAQHVGILFDQARARPLGTARTLAELNPLGGACAGSLRPGLAQRFRLASGETVELVSVHLKSGDDARSHRLRRQTLAALRRWPREPGVRLVVGGDWNTMGCADCEPPTSAIEERRLMASEARASGFLLADPAAGCSHYYRGEPTLLDGFLVAPSVGAVTQTAGACADLACVETKGGQGLGVRETVSDHCPLVLSLTAP